MKFLEFSRFSHDGVGASKSWFFIFQDQIWLYEGYFAFAIYLIDVMFWKNIIWWTNKQKSIFVSYEISRLFTNFYTMASELANHGFSFSNTNSNYVGDTSRLLSIIMIRFFEKTTFEERTIKNLFLRPLSLIADLQQEAGRSANDWICLLPPHGVKILKIYLERFVSWKAFSAIRLFTPCVNFTNNVDWRGQQLRFCIFTM